jgi:FMN-dependent NADH-azoreductase
MKLNREDVMQLLHLDSSITGEQSVSRLLTAEVVAAQRAMNPGIEVIYRDLAAAPAMHLSPAHIAVFQGAAVKSDAIGPDLALGAKYLDELFAADVIVIGAPMYNFTTPSQLKTWVDRIVVAGKTFCYTERGPIGLLPAGNKAFIAASSGGFYSGDSPVKFMEHGESYLRGVLAHIGTTDVRVIRAEDIGLGPEARARAIDAARGVVSEVSAERRTARVDRSERATTSVAQFH